MCRINFCLRKIKKFRKLFRVEFIPTFEHMGRWIIHSSCTLQLSKWRTNWLDQEMVQTEVGQVLVYGIRNWLGLRISGLKIGHFKSRTFQIAVLYVRNLSLGRFHKIKIVSIYWRVMDTVSICKRPAVSLNLTSLPGE